MQKIISNKLIVTLEQFEARMFLVRWQRVMFSMHLAKLYEVEPRFEVHEVKRNIGRFPEDFMFKLNPVEFANSEATRALMESLLPRKTLRLERITESGPFILSGGCHAN